MKKPKLILSEKLGRPTHLNLFGKLLIGFGLVLVIAFTMAGVTLLEIANLSANLDQQEKVRLRANLVSQIQRDSLQQVAQTLDLLWTQQEVTPGMEDMSVNISAHFKQLQNLETDQSLRTRLVQLSQQYNDLSETIVQTVTLNKAGQTLQAQTNWIKGSTIFGDFSERLGELGQTEEAALQSINQQSNEVRNHTVFMIILFSTLALIGAVLVALFITKLIVGQVRLLSTAMQQVVKSNISSTVVKLKVSGNDELSVMTNSFNAMLSKLVWTVEGLQTTARTVDTSSHHFSQVAQRQLAMAQQETSAVNAVVIAVTQLQQTAHQIDLHMAGMSQQAQDNLSNVTLLSSAVLEAISRVAQTQDVTRTVSNGLNHILSETTQVNLQTQELVEQLSSLQHLSQGLGTISKKTHLLALNAALECASAGVYGQRFRVIAQAVKELAEQNQTLVNTMSGFVQGIETKVKNVTEAIVKTDQELGQSQYLIGLIENIGQENVQAATKMSQAIEEIGQLVRQTVNQTGAITQATREQRQATEKIFTTLAEVEQVVKDNISSHHTSLAAVDSLRGEVSRLNILVGSL